MSSDDGGGERGGTGGKTLSPVELFIYDCRCTPLGNHFAHFRILSEDGSMRAQCSDDGVTWREMPGAPSAKTLRLARVLETEIREAVNAVALEVES